MPRGKQPVATPTGLPYGTGKESQDAQRAIPLPDNRRPPAQALGGPGAGPPTAGGVPPGPGPLDGAIAQAAMMPDAAGSLAAPTDRPGEPITAGLSTGAGPGPAAVQARQRASVADFFAIAAEVFGNDPKVARMAQRARQRGL